MKSSNQSRYLTRQSCTVFMPAFNEEFTIQQAVYDAYDVLKQTTPDFEIIVVDDGSKDQTGRILDQLSSEIEELRVITHEANYGLGRTFQSAFGAVKTDLLFFNSADLQASMRILQDFLPLLKQYDIVVGAIKKRKDSLIRIVISRFYALSIWILLGIRLKNINSLKLINCQVLAHVQIESDNAFCDAELLYKARGAGYRIGECPIDHLPRPAGRQKGAKFSTLLKTGWQCMRFVWRLRFPKVRQKEVRIGNE